MLKYARSNTYIQQIKIQKNPENTEAAQPSQGNDNEVNTIDIFQENPIGILYP